MKLYNTLTRSKEEFKPLHENNVLIYACGPTVYNYIHLGNARPLCVFDVLRRFLKHLGYKVTYVQNFTDIDDKIIKKANEEGIGFEEVSRKYIEEYQRDTEGLNLKKAEYNPKATENIKEIIKSIEVLIEKGFAYEASNGDVYFKTREFKSYGKLSNQSLDDLQAGSRIQVDESKKDVLDFALWKAAKPGEPYWESPWGNGRPGWHIECSVMAQKYLGKTIDIHCGGQDLIFPHHENEIAQSECISGKKFSNYWLHNGYINIDNQKMSKSANNFFTVRDIAGIYGYEAIRYLMIASHYRSPINYSEDIIKQCQAAVGRLYNFKENLDFALKNAISGNKSDSIISKVNEYKEQFLDALNDDLNTANALGVLFEFVRYINTNVLSLKSYNKEDIKHIMETFLELTEILGLIQNNGHEQSTDNSKIEALIKQRETARKEKNWKLADEIRDKLIKQGVVLEDTPQGTKYSFK